MRHKDDRCDIYALDGQVLQRLPHHWREKYVIKDVLDRGLSWYDKGEFAHKHVLRVLNDISYTLINKMLTNRNPMTKQKTTCPICGGVIEGLELAQKVVE